MEGSRWPSRLRLGPESKTTRLIVVLSSVCSHVCQGSEHIGLGNATHDLDATGAIEHEGQVLVCLLVPAHEGHQLRCGGVWRESGGQVVGADDLAVLLDPALV